MKLQLQPDFENIRPWQTLACTAGLTFEVHDLTKVIATETAEYLERYIAWYRASGLVSSVHGAYIDINPCSADTEIAALSKKRILESCAFAKKLGAKNIVFHSSSFPFLRGKYLENYARAAADYYSETADRTGLRIFLENSFDLDPDPLAAVMRCAGSPLLGCCLDIGHANVSRAPLSAWFETLGNTVGYLHFSDNNGQWDDHMALGTGSVDWETVHAGIRKLPADIPATLETGSLENAETSLAFLKESGWI